MNMDLVLFVGLFLLTLLNIISNQRINALHRRLDGVAQDVSRAEQRVGWIESFPYGGGRSDLVMVLNQRQLMLDQLADKCGFWWNLTTGEWRPTSPPKVKP